MTTTPFSPFSTVVPQAVPPQRGSRRRRSVVLLHAPRSGPGPRERRATFEATPDWAWTCAVVYAARLDLAADPCLAEQLQAADLVVCADDDLLDAVVASGLHAVAVTGPWPTPERWTALLEDLHAVVSG